MNNPMTLYNYDAQYRFFFIAFELKLSCCVYIHLGVLRRTTKLYSDKSGGIFRLLYLSVTLIAFPCIISLHHNYCLESYADKR